MRVYALFILTPNIYIWFEEFFDIDKYKSITVIDWWLAMNKMIIYNFCDVFTEQARRNNIEFAVAEDIKPWMQNSNHTGRTIVHIAVQILHQEIQLNSWVLLHC